MATTVLLFCGIVAECTVAWRSSRRFEPVVKRFRIVEDFLKNYKSAAWHAAVIGSVPYGVGVFATRDMRRGERLAEYPVEIVAHCVTDNPSYCVRVVDADCTTTDCATDHDVHLVASDVTARSLSTCNESASNSAPCIAMFSNEPGPSGAPNAQFHWPRVASVGDAARGLAQRRILVSYLTASRDIAAGEEITWCYGRGYHRDYDTSCPHIVTF